MADPWGIVLVPAEGDPGGLLADTLFRYGTWTFGWNDEHRGWGVWEPLPVDVKALPLWWDGALVPEGWDRARRVYREAIRASGGTPVGAAQLDYPSWARVAEYASWMVLRHPPLASRVVLLDLVDGRLVEREPSGPEPQQR